MKYKVNKGTIGFYIAGTIFLAASLAFFIFWRVHATPEAMYARGQIYGEGNFDRAAFRVRGISEVLNEDEERNLYVVAHDNGYNILETAKGDKQIQRIEENIENLETEVFLLDADIIDSDTEWSDYAAEAARVFELAIDTDEHLSRYQSGLTDKFIAWMFIGIGIIGIAMFYGAFAVRAGNKKQYRILFDAYPELEDSLGSLEADFAEANHNLAVYKKHLISTIGKVQVFAIQDIQKIKKKTVYIYHGLLSRTVVHSLELTLQGSRKKKVISIPNSLVKWDDWTRVDRLLLYLREKNPHIDL